MKVIYLRSNPVKPDPRVEKEVVCLLAHGYSVEILCWDRSGELPKRELIETEQGSASIVRWRGKSTFGGGFKNILKLSCFQIFLLFHLLKNWKTYDIIHAADFDTVLPGLLIKTIFKKKLVYDIFDFYVDAFPVPERLRFIIKRLDFFVMKKADAVIITNEHRKLQIEGALPKSLHVIHNSPSSFIKIDRSSFGCPPAFTLVYVGILQPGRLLREAIEIFTQKPDWKLVIAGFGALEDEIRRSSERYGNIEYHGIVDYREGLSLSAKADALFATYDPEVPNHKFSSPNKLYEAMLLAKPLIVCKGTGIDELVVESRIGLSINYNGADFERALCVLAENPDTARSMGGRATKLYREQFSWEIMEKRLLDLYDQLSI
jgi:glycosyltransferase involved in cell wall biosynthesis